MALIVYPRTNAQPLFQKNPTAVFAASPYQAQIEVLIEWEGGF
jgi:hypothetical protein